MILNWIIYYIEIQKIFSSRIFYISLYSIFKRLFFPPFPQCPSFFNYHYVFKLLNVLYSQLWTQCFLCSYCEPVASGNHCKLPHVSFRCDCISVSSSLLPGQDVPGSLCTPPIPNLEYQLFLQGALFLLWRMRFGLHLLLAQFSGQS